MSYVFQVALIGMFAGMLGTGLGGLIILLVRKPKQSFLAFLLAFSGGIMLGVVLMDLIPEALEIGNAWSTIVGMVIGVLLLMIINRHLPHIHPGSNPNSGNMADRFARAGLLLGLGIAMHNLPEGLAIGAGYLASEQLGIGLAMALALHNIPEGMAMAGPMIAGGIRSPKILFWTAAAGVPMGVGAFIGALFGSLSPAILSGALGFAGGAMTYIVFHELLPGARRMENLQTVFYGAATGILVWVIVLLTL